MFDAVVEARKIVNKKPFFFGKKLFILGSATIPSQFLIDKYPDIQVIAIIGLICFTGGGYLWAYEKTQHEKLQRKTEMSVSYGR